ncbi:hypothetical protein VWQ25_002381 [Salmonella enterica]|nr:hypothetical protein [Salmonella enterica]EMD6450973.1 hypothetical protein [Salmonella enterica]EMD9674657.1 hypothetical protein [Salmonella enterica]
MKTSIINGSEVSRLSVAIHLRKQNYDVDTYYRIENQQEEIADDEMQSLYHNLAVEEGEPVYLEGGMYLYPDGSIR